MITKEKIKSLQISTGLVFAVKNFAIYEEIGFSKSFLSFAFTKTLQGEVLSKALKGIGGEYDEFVSSEPLEFSVNCQSRVFEHPLETNIGKNKTGSSVGDIYSAQQNFIADHSIELPIVANLKMVFPQIAYRDLDKELELLKKTKTLLAIVSRASVYHNMVITDYNHNEEPYTLDRMRYNINFREIQAEYPLANVVKNPDDTGVSR